MSVMLILLGASLTVGLLFLIAFIWSVKSGQMDDTFSPAHKVLFEDTKPQKPLPEDHTTQAKTK